MRWKSTSFASTDRQAELTHLSPLRSQQQETLISKRTLLDFCYFYSFSGYTSIKRQLFMLSYRGRRSQLPHAAGLSHRGVCAAMLLEQLDAACCCSSHSAAATSLLHLSICYSVLFYAAFDSHVHTLDCRTQSTAARSLLQHTLCRSTH